jgi:hypothetical protein
MTSATLDPVTTGTGRPSGSVTMTSSSGRIRFWTALVLATVFKVMAVLTVIGGAIVAAVGATDIQNRAGETGVPQGIAPFITVVVTSTIISSAFFAFFGYVLEILVRIYEQAWHTRQGETGVAESV